MSMLRGLIGPVTDVRAERDAEVQAIVRELDAR
jgi:hypothetical protein